MTIIQIISILIAFSFPVLLYLNRFLVPDISFDSVNYHLLLGARFWDMLTLHPILSREFIPTGLHNYPGLIDLPAYLFYSLFGYRLSTLTSVLSILSIVMVAGLAVNWKRSTPKQVLMGLALINLVFVNEALFQVATNMVEGISALVLFVGVVLFSKADVSRWRSVMIAGLVIGISIGIKFTNLYVLIFSIPYFAGLILVDSTARLKHRVRITTLFLICTMIPLGIWGVTQYVKTGNPVFPYYNNLFRSTFYPENAYSMPQYGPENLAQAVVWPIYSALVPERLGELGGWFADYRLIGYFGVIVPLLFLQTGWRGWRGRRGRIQRELLVVIGAGVLGTLSWSIFSGYIRFVVGVEFILGYAILLLVSTSSFSPLASLPALRARFSRNWKLWVQFGAFLLFLIALGCHLFLGRRLMIRNSLFDYSWRPPARVNPELHKRQLPLLFERTLQLELDPENGSANDQQFIQTPDIYLNCGLPSTSLYVLSEFREQSVPVVVVNRGAYGGLMDTCEYTSEVMKRVGGGDESGAEVGGEFGVGAEGEPNSTKRLNENSAQESAREELTYVTLFLEHFHDINGQDCRFNLERIGATVESTRSGTILGSDTARVIEWRGRLPVDQYLSACGE